MLPVKFIPVTCLGGTEKADSIHCQDGLGTELATPF